MINKLITHIKENSPPLSKDSARLFHGRGKNFHDFDYINIDFFNPVLLIYLYHDVPDEFLRILSTELIKISNKIKGVLVQRRNGAKTTVETFWGICPTEIYANENGLRYHLRFRGTQNIGFFPDMKILRSWLTEHSSSKRILNLFAYTCSLSVAAAKGGAEAVINVDMNNNSLSVGKKNHAINDLSNQSIKYLPHNIFKSWGKIKKGGPYDLIIIDPPFFQTGSFNFKKDYQKIINRLPDLIQSKGQVIATLNSPYLNSHYLIQQFKTCCPQFDYREKISLPEGFTDLDPEKGLKILLFESSL